MYYKKKYTMQHNTEKKTGFVLTVITAMANFYPAW